MILIHAAQDVGCPGRQRILPYKPLIYTCSEKLLTFVNQRLRIGGVPGEPEAGDGGGGAALGAFEEEDAGGEAVGVANDFNDLTVQCVAQGGVACEAHGVGFGDALDDQADNLFLGLQALIAYAHRKGGR